MRKINNPVIASEAKQSISIRDCFVANAPRNDDRIRKNLFVFLFAFCLLCVLPAKPALAQNLKVVTTTSTYASLVKEIGREKVDVRFVAPPRFNVHFVEPKPSDVRALSGADLFVHTGLDLELWADPLVEAAGRPEFFRGAERSLDLSKGILLLDPPQGALSRAQGDLHLFGNPHYWMDPRNTQIMARSISDKLTQIDPSNGDYYQANAAGFLEKLETKIAEWKALCAHCADKEIVSYHKDIEYLADFLGIKVARYVEPLPGIPPTPKHLVELEKYIGEKGVRLIVQPVFYPTNAVKSMARRTGCQVQIVCQNVGEMGTEEDIFGFFDRNILTLSEALRK
jgi:zinc/manganese transport system substrate-binding protein